MFCPTRAATMDIHPGMINTMFIILYIAQKIKENF